MYGLFGVTFQHIHFRYKSSPGVPNTLIYIVKLSPVQQIQLFSMPKWLRRREYYYSACHVSSRSVNSIISDATAAPAQ